MTNDAGATRLEISTQENGAGKLTLSSKSEDTGSDTVEMEAEISMGTEQKRIAFNSNCLMDMLGTMAAEELTLEANAPSAPGPSEN